MTHWLEWFPSKFLSAIDLEDSAHPVVISHIVMEDIGADDKQEKPVMYFQGHSKGMVLNKTNAKKISTMHGDDPGAWQGKGIIIFPTMVSFGDEEKLGIRVKAQAPAGFVTSPSIGPEGVNLGGSPVAAPTDQQQTDKETEQQPQPRKRW